MEFGNEDMRLRRATVIDRRYICISFATFAPLRETPQSPGF